MNRAAILIFMAVYFFTALVLPTLAVWRRTGVLPLTFMRTRAPRQRIVGAAFSACLLAVASWTASWVVNPEWVGVWTLPPAFTALGWFLMFSGLLITLAAQRQMGDAWRIGVDSEPTALVAKGLFRVVRNPIFTSMLITLLGWVALMPNGCSAALWVVIAAVISIQVRLEERHLGALHGRAYLDYASRVGRFLPGLGRLR